MRWVAFGSDSKSLPETLTSKAGRGRESGESEVVRVDRTGSDTKKKTKNYLRHDNLPLNSVSVATELLGFTMISLTHE